LPSWRGAFRRRSLAEWRGTDGALEGFEHFLLLVVDGSQVAVSSPHLSQHRQQFRIAFLLPFLLAEGGFGAHVEHEIEEVVSLSI
jgi:hypothetical protein